MDPVTLSFFIHFILFHLHPLWQWICSPKDRTFVRPIEIWASWVLSLKHTLRIESRLVSKQMERVMLQSWSFWTLSRIPAKPQVKCLGLCMVSILDVTGVEDMLIVPRRALRAVYWLWSFDLWMFAFRSDALSLQSKKRLSRFMGSRWFKCTVCSILVYCIRIRVMTIQHLEDVGHSKLCVPCLAKRRKTQAQYALEEMEWKKVTQQHDLRRTCGLGHLHQMQIGEIHVLPAISIPLSASSNLDLYNDLMIYMFWWLSF